MAYIVAFVSQKGGVGKSTLARALAREAAASEANVKIADLDVQQGTSQAWQRIREQQEVQPRISVEAFGSARDALAEADRYDLLIIDGPARASSATAEIAKRAHLIVQPTSATLDDLTPAVGLFHGLQKAGVSLSRLTFALNHVGTQAEEDAARGYLGEAGYDVLPGSLPQRPAYGQAMNIGRSITETPFPSLNKRADTLIQALIDEVNDNG